MTAAREWLGDVAVRTLSLAHRGAWADLRAAVEAHGEGGRLRLSWERLERLWGLGSGSAREMAWDLITSGVCRGTVDDHGATVSAALPPERPEDRRRRLTRERVRKYRAGGAGTKTRGEKRLSSRDVTHVTENGVTGNVTCNAVGNAVSRYTDVDAVIAHYQQYHPRSRGGKKIKAKIQDRLREGYSVDDLRQAIDGCHRSPYHCGANDAGRRYQSLELIVRDSEHVAQFIELLEAPGAPLSKADQVSLGQGLGWVPPEEDGTRRIEG